jgi:hypothetical protein
LGELHGKKLPVPSCLAEEIVTFIFLPEHKKADEIGVKLPPIRISQYDTSQIFDLRSYMSSSRIIASTASFP